MTYDLIIIARSTTPRLIQMTQNCINSAGADHVILVETGDNIDYQGVDQWVGYGGPFNYNRALNRGLQYAKGDVHILANNDLIFYEGWRTIGNYMVSYGFDSASAWFKGSKFSQGDFVYKGYEVATHLLGWCLFITKEAMQKIGQLNEGVDFWYSDNVYADQLKQHGLQHGLFCNVRVDHIGSQTLSTMPMKIKRQYSIVQLAKYNQLKTTNYDKCKIFKKIDNK